jgi:hypothetical protein
MDPSMGMSNVFAQELLRSGKDPELACSGHGHGHGHGHDGARDGNRPNTPATKRGALSYHRRNERFVKRIIDSALSIQVDPTQGFDSRPNLLHNSAEWIDEGQATMFVLSPVHDAHLRPSVAADQTAFFDNQVAFGGGGADYDDSLDAAGNATNDTGLEIEFSSTLGTMSGDGNTLTVIDPIAQGENVVVETIIHEVQHDADQHKAGDPWAVTAPANDPASVDSAFSSHYNAYQSEFRAYWMENPEGSTADNFGSSTDNAVTNFNITAVEQGADQTTGGGDDQSVTVTTAFTNKRQEDIFRHMFSARADNVYWDSQMNGGAGGWTVSYAYLPHYYALDPNFKTMIDGYAMPAAGNLVNSVRIQALSDALDGGTMIDVRAALDDLDALDMRYLSDRSQSQPVWDQAQVALSAPEFAEFEVAIQAPMGPYRPEEVTIQRGDTLTTLARRYLADGGRWREIYDLNRDVIGNDPEMIRVGDELELPRM